MAAAGMALNAVGTNAAPTWEEILSRLKSLGLDDESLRPQRTASYCELRTRKEKTLLFASEDELRSQFNRQLGALGMKYVPWKGEKKINKMDLADQIKLLFLSVFGHTFSGVAAETKQRQIASERRKTKRTIQNNIFKASKIPGFEVHQQPGRPNTFRFGIEFLFKVGLLEVLRPKAEPKPVPFPPPSPAQIREVSRKAEDFSARYYRLLNEGKTREEALRELYRPTVPGEQLKKEPESSEGVPMIREVLSVMGRLKSMLPPRAG